MNKLLCWHKNIYLETR